jgi:rod shape-determining protein MreC
MWMAHSRSPYGARRLAIVCFALLLVALFLLPNQVQGLLQYLDGPVGYVVRIPLEAIAFIDAGIADRWEQYVALQGVREENQQLRKEIEWLRGQQSQLRESVAATERLTALLQFKEQALPTMVAAQVIGRDATNRYRAIILNKGEGDGIKPDMGVVTPAGVVGRVVKTTGASSVVLLVTDPSNAIAGLIQRTRDEGVVEGTQQGLAQMKYIPLLSTVRDGDRVVTSGLVGDFPRGLVIGTITRIDKQEGALFRSCGGSVGDSDFIWAVHEGWSGCGSARKTITVKSVIYLILVLLLVPLQTTLLPHLSVWNVKPDLGLVAAVLVGLFAGELEGLLVGLAIGWVLSLFSAGELWLSLLTNGGAGLLAGFLGRQVSQMTSLSLGLGLLLVSLVSGAFAALNFQHFDGSQMWWMIESIVFPQACFDGVVGGALYWILSQRFDVIRLRTE